MRKFLFLTIGLVLSTIASGYGQVGSIKAETYQAEFEKKQSIEDVSDYDGPTIPIALLNISATDEVYEMWPDLKDNRIGLGVTNMVIEYLEWTNRFQFVEEKSEIKERMTAQWKASKKGVSENEVYGFGKIKLAEYFVTIEIYDFSVSEDEVLSLKDGSKQTQTTRLGLQVRFTNATDGTYFVGSGLGDANTVKTQEGLLGLDVEEIKFRQSAIGVTTRKALETASSRIVSRMIKKGIFAN
jgi:curli biogenesis system outer membrane secretion channel CsgG